MRKIQHYVIAIALAFAAGVSGAQEVTPSVEVPGVKNPDMKSYRAVVAGLDAFKNHHALAPDVPELRFRLAARGGGEVPAGDPLYLRIVGDGDPIPVPIAADGTFSVPRVQAAIDDDASLILNRKKGVLKGRPDIQTPGLPANMRRLGDLRLECHVMVAIGKEEIGLMLTLLVNTVAMTTNWCDMTFNKERAKFSFASLRLLERAELVEGERREALEIDDFSFSIALGDNTWSNDARIELRYAPELTAEEKSNPWLRPIYVRGSMDDWKAYQPLKRQEDGTYTAEVEFAKGSHQLKLGTRGYPGIDLGAPTKDVQPLADQASVPLIPGGKNLRFKTEQPGRYVLTLDARDKDAPTVRLALAQ